VLSGPHSAAHRFFPTATVPRCFSTLVLSRINGHVNV
jgi:hypothetical protein